MLRSAKEEQLVVRGRRFRRLTRGDHLQTLNNCKLDGIDPFAYFRDILERFASHPIRTKFTNCYTPQLEEGTRRFQLELTSDWNSQFAAKIRGR